MEQIHQLFAYDGLKIVQDDRHLAFSVDSLLLADFVQIPKRVKRIADFGCGNGPIPLYLSLKTKKPIFGFDIQPSSCELAKKSVEINHLTQQIQIIHQDIRRIHQQYPASYFDIIVSNPPFFPVPKTPILNAKEPLSIARHETHLTLEELFQQVKRLLSTGGLFYIVHRTDRLQDLFRYADQFGFGVKRMRFVYPNPQKDAHLVLMELSANGSKLGLHLEQPFFIQTLDQEYTVEMKKIHFFGREETF